MPNNKDCSEMQIFKAGPYASWETEQERKISQKQVGRIHSSGVSAHDLISADPPKPGCDECGGTSLWNECCSTILCSSRSDTGLPHPGHWGKLWWTGCWTCMYSTLIKNIFRCTKVQIFTWWPKLSTRSYFSLLQTPALTRATHTCILSTHNKMIA